MLPKNEKNNDLQPKIKLNYRVWIKAIHIENCTSKFLQFSRVQYPMAVPGGILLKIYYLHKYQVKRFCMNNKFSSLVNLMEMMLMGVASPHLNYPYVF